MSVTAVAQKLLFFFGPLKLSKNDQNHRPNRSVSHEGPRKHSVSSCSEEFIGNSCSHQNVAKEIQTQNMGAEFEETDLNDLNSSLVMLAAIFPDIEVKVFREILSTFDKESRLAVVTETLLKHKSKWIKGRYKTANKGVQEGSRPLNLSGQVPAQEMFRSTNYKNAVKKILSQEFKGLSRSIINDTLADFNYSYTLARPTLTVLTSRSWRFYLPNLLKKKGRLTSLDLKNHPLVTWQANDYGSFVPILKSSGCLELDQEICESLITPQQQRVKAEQEAKDYKMALQLNGAEIGQTESLLDCQCCYAATDFQELTSCGEGHLTCFQCVQKTLKEAVFGQGWRRSINMDQGTLKCIAATSDNCASTIPVSLIHQALENNKIEKNLMQKFDERLADVNVLNSRLPLIRCPFCSYAEVDELYIPETKKSFSFRSPQIFSFDSFLITLVGVTMIPLIILVFFFLSLFLLTQGQFLGTYLANQFNSVVDRIRRKHLGLKFCCKNEFCHRESCRFCLKEWFDIHICHESSLQDLRTQVELAMSIAVKRTCPRCNTSFVKSSGCNKLTCVCGYQMCYICRKKISAKEGYSHFCEHFRPNGARSCTECKKCDLYRCEDDEVVIKKAKQEAERQWMEREENLLGRCENFRTVLLKRLKESGDISLVESRGWNWRLPSKEQILDALIERLILVK